MIYPRVLPVCTDYDTVFSMVKSIHGYWCVYFFCHVISDYLFVMCMQRESNLRGSYQDFIYEIARSELIVTKNLQTKSRKIGNLLVGM